ncbi:MAG: ATP phosphoribosyltransferase [Nitrospinae bacterium]|nr:ATP phosphoribosyltransferase [Nitrospinota bacterium]
MKENQEKELIIALPKGRIFTEATECLVKAGVLSKPISDKSRKLILRDAKTGIRVLILRNHDVPIYVERGAADLGVIGRDVLLEQGRDVYEPLDLKVAPCRLMVAAPEGMTWADLNGRISLRVATKFPAITTRFFEQMGVQAKIIRLYGNVEIAPATGVADLVVDLVDTGGTLRANGLAPIREIFSATARLIANRASLKTNYKKVSAIIEQLKGVIPTAQHRSGNDAGAASGGEKA